MIKLEAGWMKGAAKANGVYKFEYYLQDSADRRLCREYAIVLHLFRHAESLGSGSDYKYGETA